MPNASAGILLYRYNDDQLLEALLVHPGGPFWKNKDLGAWSIPKGLFSPGEDRLKTARREFNEELGSPINGEFIELDPIRQAGGKTVYCFAVEGELDTSEIKSNTFTTEWPPRSGKQQEFPEVDRAEWLDIPAARTKINAAQAAFLDQLIERVG